MESTNKTCDDFLQRNFLSKDRYGSEYYDASGKCSSGVLSGSLTWLGNYQDCLSLPDAQYCLIEYNAPVLGDLREAIEVRWGLCVESVCSQKNIVQNLSQLISDPFFGGSYVNSSNVTIKHFHCEKEAQSFLSLLNGASATIALLCIIAGVVVISTVRDLVISYKRRRVRCIIQRRDSNEVSLIHTRHDSESSSSGACTFQTALHGREGFGDFCLNSLSAKRNLTNLVSVKADEKRIRSLDAIRVLSAAWLVLGHTFLAVYKSDLVANPASINAYMSSFSWQIISNCYLVIDTFLFISGLLVSYKYVALDDSKEFKKFPWFKYYFSRFLRLTPALLVMLLFWSNIFPSVGNGPIWHKTSSDTKNCFNYWWTNILFIQNFYPTDITQQCMRWTWYLSVDFQLYFFAPILIIFLAKDTRKGVAIFLSALLGTYVITATIIAALKVDVDVTASLVYELLEQYTHYEDWVYDKPYCRMAPFLIGMLLGWVLRVNREGSLVNRMAGLAIGWVCAFATMFFCIFGLFESFHAGRVLNSLENIFYGSLASSGWALALAWVVYCCERDCAGVLGSLLRWRGWQPLSRLTFGAYLLHPLVISFYVFSRQQAVLVDSTYLVYLFFSFLVLSFLASVLLYLFVEQPFRNFGKRCSVTN